MKYIDSGIRDAAHALGTWLQSLDSQSVCSFRFQSGYFTAAGVAPLRPLFEALARRNQPISCVLGSNGGETTQRDVEQLVDLIGCPRPDARIAVVSYATGLYHPKIYHAIRADGTRTAYVGSANLTLTGVTGGNVEAGLILDTATGDPAMPLDQMAAAVDGWFAGSRAAVSLVQMRRDVPRLVRAGILGQPRPRQARRRSAPGGGGGPSFGLAPLVRFPAPGHGGGVPGHVHPKPNYPPYVLQDPNAAGPTIGANALTGAQLSPGATGIVVRLTRDSAKAFARREGTPNVSLPIPTMHTLRFGIWGQGKRPNRPRCEFGFRLRFVDDTGVRRQERARTGVMVYGYEPQERGNGNIRMQFPRGPAEAVREFAINAQLPIPAAGDPMLLRWPTPADPSFKATVPVRGSHPFRALENALASAGQRGQAVGRTACWFNPRMVRGRIP